MSHALNEPAVYSAKDVAALLDLNVKTVREAAARGEIPVHRVGRRLLFPKPAIDAWLSAAGGTMGAPTRVTSPRSDA